MEGTWEAMSQIIIQQECARQLDTIRMRAIERSCWSQGKCMEHGPRVLECQKVGSAQKHAKMYEGTGIELLRSGSNISNQIMSAKME